MKIIFQTCYHLTITIKSFIMNIVWHSWYCLWQISLSVANIIVWQNMSLMAWLHCYGFTVWSATHIIWCGMAASFPHFSCLSNQHQLWWARQIPAKDDNQADGQLTTFFADPCRVNWFCDLGVWGRCLRCPETCCFFHPHHLNWIMWVDKGVVMIIKVWVVQYQWSLCLWTSCSKFKPHL